MRGPGGSSRGKAPTTRRVPSLMMHATWNGAVIAESDRTVVVEGNHYFPPDDVNFDLLRPVTGVEAMESIGRLEALARP